jgi:DNA-binding response OmpR family regulator
MRILIIEDEIALSNVLSEILKKNNYAVDAVYDGADGLDYAVSGLYDAILLDIMLPKMNGLEMLQALRSQGHSTPVLLLTAKSEIEDKVKGLDCGADDYITKPFATDELLARVRSVLRRKDVFISSEQSFGDLTIDKNTLKIATKKDEIKMSLKEYQILEMLIINPNQIISKEKFVEKIWGYDFDGEYNSVEVYISFVRKKLTAIGSKVKIKAHRGVGYSLEVRND